MVQGFYMFKSLYVVFVFLLLSSCVGVSKLELNKIQKIGVLSEVGNKVDVVFPSTEIFTNNVETIKLKNWDVDSFIESKVVESLQSKYEVYSLGGYRGLLKNKYNPAPKFGDGYFNYEALAKELASFGKDHGLDTVIYISPRAGDAGAKYAHVLNAKGTIEYDGAITASDLYAFVVNVETGEIVQSLDTYNIGEGPITRTAKVMDERLAALTPEDIHNLNKDNSQLLKLYFEENLKRVIPILIHDLL